MPEGLTSRRGHCSTRIPGCDLYMREGATTTFHVAESECRVDCGPIAYPNGFVWANPTGDIALFAGCAKLTDDSSAYSACIASSLRRATT